MVSEKLRHALIAERIRGARQYEVARKAALHPTVLSAIVRGAIPVKRNDRRVLRLGEVLGLKPDECFEEASDV